MSLMLCICLFDTVAWPTPTTRSWPSYTRNTKIKVPPSPQLLLPLFFPCWFFIFFCFLFILFVVIIVWNILNQLSVLLFSLAILPPVLLFIYLSFIGVENQGCLTFQVYVILRRSRDIGVSMQSVWEPRAWK